eukprot:TRINITY_DN705_c0_g1_i6.p1 TRINITY_DN705_c0_g1~~TRINITY_DN705_c0_g1_i6.p1  ORF type:complete len:129 (+),score=35.28 TRINITY_DN705_c0_g1_i6:64-450(+)
MINCLDDYEEIEKDLFLCSFSGACAALVDKNFAHRKDESGVGNGNGNGNRNRNRIRISHVLTVADNTNTPAAYYHLKVSSLKDVIFKHVLVSDSLDEDLLSIFPQCFSFINNAITKGGAVIVHWYENI